MRSNRIRVLSLGLLLVLSVLLISGCAIVGTDYKQPKVNIPENWQGDSLLVASGAGAESRKTLGTTVFGGMLVATVVSLIAVPMFFYVIQSLSDKARGKKKLKD